MSIKIGYSVRRVIIMPSMKLLYGSCASCYCVLLVCLMRRWNCYCCFVLGGILMFVLVNDKTWFSGDYTPSDARDFLLYNRHDITEIRAYGYDLVKCFNILGRNPPNFNTMDGERSYTFIGDNAKEIAANWY